ncbi:sodium:solute symporter [Lewinellaceae bacterium SD302]|nr:sodium:solute symporter [Lewinellaceae bacterium SD302]
MHLIDWLIMGGTLAAIVIYGVYKTRNIHTADAYLRGERDLKWWTIGLSVMATQASAITFLSTPGQAFEDGMGFAQFYFGLPIAMVILCIFVLPIYYRLNVYTAYEYLEGRFDVRVRVLTAILFLIQRGLAAGITIYAPAIILSKILGWSLGLTVLLIGIVVIFYTVVGGSKAVSVTQKQQMIVILIGMAAAAVVVIYKLPPDIGFSDALNLAGKTGKLEVVDWNFDLRDRYNIWSGLIGGVFLFLSYFGTDQSQVQRYLSGKSLTESRLGLLFNGIFKVPMQFMVLFVGVLVYVFFLFNRPPVHFNSANLETVRASERAPDLAALEDTYAGLMTERENVIQEMATELKRPETEQNGVDELQGRLQAIDLRDKEIRGNVDAIIESVDPDAKTVDKDYVFITFIVNYLPIGLIGILLAVIFSAAMSSTSSELSALATTSMVDLYRRLYKKDEDDAHYLSASKWLTILWGGIALTFAFFADLFDNLIQAVNIIGSLFYGVILGIFVVAFLFKKIGGRAVLIAAIVTEILIIATFVLNQYGIIDLAYLWLNLIGCVVTVILAALINPIYSGNQPGSSIETRQ